MQAHFLKQGFNRPDCRQVADAVHCGVFVIGRCVGEFVNCLRQ